jgi:hypothetical protein
MIAALLGVAAIIAGGTLLLVSVVLLGAAAGGIGIARTSHSWPTVPGRVVRSEIRANRRANGLPGFRTLVRYEYVVDGEEYEGRELAGGDFPYRGAVGAARRLAAYPVGALVTVRYDPTEPDIAVLETGVSVDVLYLPIMATLLMVAALAIFSWGGWRLFRVLTP